jgi:DUF1009 family protein
MAEKIIPEKLGIIAGNGSYPLLLAEGARSAGVQYIFTVAFKKETDRGIEKKVDKIKWLNFGQFQAAVDALKEEHIQYAVLAGQITPTNLFYLRPDGRALALLKKIKVKTAHSIFGTVSDELQKEGIILLPAHSFMEHTMPEKGVLTRREPDEREMHDIQIGIKVAKIVGSLDIGQTIAIKDGAVLAVEAFEGTDEAILRAGRLGNGGIVVVKVAKAAHDMRFDIPVIGARTIKALKKAKATALAIEAHRTIILEKDFVIGEAEKSGLSIVAVEKE